MSVYRVPRRRRRTPRAWLDHNGHLTEHGEQMAEAEYEADRGHRNPLGEIADDPGPDGCGWASDPYPED